jgi:hypothetical protein
MDASYRCIGWAASELLAVATLGEPLINPPQYPLGSRHRISDHSFKRRRTRRWIGLGQFPCRQNAPAAKKRFALVMSYLNPSDFQPLVRAEREMAMWSAAPLYASVSHS